MRFVFFVLFSFLVIENSYANKGYKYEKQPFEFKNQKFDYIHYDYKNDKVIKNIYFIFVDSNEPNPMLMLTALNFEDLASKHSAEIVVFYPKNSSWNTSDSNIEIEKINRMMNFFEIKNFKKFDESNNIKKYAIGYGSGATVMNQYFCKYDKEFDTVLSVNGGLIHDKCNMKNINSTFITFISKENNRWSSISPNISIMSYINKIKSERGCENVYSDKYVGDILTKKEEYEGCDKKTKIYVAETKEHFFPGNNYPYWKNSPIQKYSAVNMLDFLNSYGKIIW